jgi:hypothetical protein
LHLKASTAAIGVSGHRAALVPSQNKARLAVSKLQPVHPNPRQRRMTTLEICVRSQQPSKRLPILR